MHSSLTVFNLKLRFLMILLLKSLGKQKTGLFQLKKLLFFQSGKQI